MAIDATKKEEKNNNHIAFVPVAADSHQNKMETAKQMLQNDEKLCCIILHDNTLDANNTKDILWHVLNNYNPQTDCIIENNCLIIDGSSKIEQEQLRDWPTPVTSDEATIQLVDSKWNTFNLGDFIPSPSIQYRKLFEKDSAWRYKN
jgi:3-polyprenyl-4-hydroxybenzoate decarboxylase